MRPFGLVWIALVGLSGVACQPDTPPRPDLFVARGDLPEIRQRGSLRILTPSLREEELPRAGSPSAEDRDMGVAFAERLGVRAEFILVESRSEILDYLVWGYGDVVAAQLTVTPNRAGRVRFTLPTASVSEWLVGRKGEPNLPRTMLDLDGREIHLRRSSAFTETLYRLQDEWGISLKLVFVSESLDTESLAYDVSQGKRPLTVVDSNLLVSLETYNDELERLFVLSEGRELSWAVRKDAVELATAADAFMIEHFLTVHRDEDRSTGDLEAIRARGSLRVLTLNNPVNYFAYRGRLMGFDYDVARLAAEKLGVRLELIVPPRRDLIFDWLLEGRGDVIASTLTVTPERQDRMAFSRPYLFIEELLVQASSSEDKVRSAEDLAGRTIHVWESSSHYQTLSRLQQRFGPFSIVPIPEDIEFDEILDRVASGAMPLSVLDSHILEAELSYREDVEVVLSLSAISLPDPETDETHTVVAVDKAVAFAVRADNVELQAFFDDFVSELVGTLEYNIALNRYFRDNRRLPRVKQHRSAVSGRLSPFDDVIKKYAVRYGLDWRLLVAQAYRESRFDPNAESWAGARGVFQLLPSTAFELGFENLSDVEIGIHAGVKYMHALMQRLDTRIPLKHRLRFALAAYNAGWGHLEDARRLASELGLDPNKWFGHTEKAMLLLKQPEYYRKARYGYVRGTETVAYVSEIQNLYDHYVMLVPHS